MNLIERIEGADLLPMEIEVLRILNGEDVPGWSWGAAMAECCSSLKGKGYAAGMYDITAKGRAALRAIGDTHDD